MDKKRTSQPSDTPENQQTAAQETGAKAPAVLDEKRKIALLRYMGVLFGVAFLLVLLSSLVQMRNSRLTISELNQASNNALQNAEALQTMNRELVEQNTALVEENAQLEQQRDESQALADQRKSQLDELGNQLERVESLHQKQLAELDRQLTATQALARAQYAQAAEDEAGFQAAMAQLKELADYLDEDGKAIYQALLTEKQPD